MAHAQSFSGFDISGSARVHVGNAFYGSDNHERTDDQNIGKCRNALFLTDPAIDRETLISAKGERVAGTCEWIREDHTYRRWVEGDFSLLWISGGPGKGKTMLSIFLTQELEKTSKENSQIVYYFCRNDDDKQNSATAVLRGLLWHILGRRPDLANHLLQYFESSERTQSSLSSRETLWTMFAKILEDSSLHPTTCVLDGLDECDEASRAWLVKKLVGLTLPKEPASKRPPFNLAIVSRHMPGLEGSPRVKLDPDHDQEIKSDIEIFVSDRVDELSHRVALSNDFRRYVEGELLKGANGTFLWVGFAMTELSEKQTCLEIEETLCTLPKGLPAIYGRMLLQIEPRRRISCASILNWVTLATRPLSVGELALALCVRPTSILTAEHAMREEIALCGPMLVIENNRVSLVHQSARDYLLRKENDSNTILEGFRISPESAHAELAWTCLNYMQQRSLDLDSGGDLSYWDPTPHATFMEYALFHWPTHATSSKMLALKLLDHPCGFFENGSTLRMQWWRVYVSGVFWPLDKTSLTPLHMACYVGFIPWIKHCLQKNSQETERRSHINELDFYDRTPLMYAVRKGHEEVARLLLDCGADVNATACFGQTALHEATREGHNTVVRLLLDCGADTGAKDSYGETALWAAAFQGNIIAVELLLSHGANVHAKEDMFEDGAFHRAAIRGDTAVVRLLLDYGAGCDTRERGRPVLNAAAANGHEATVRLLLECGANINAQDTAGNTALYAAAERGYEAVVRVLLDHGANADAKNNKGHTALYIATVEVYEAVMQLLTSARSSSPKSVRDVGQGSMC